MIIRILFFLILAAAITLWILKKRNIQINLTPLGRTTLGVVFRQILRFILRKIGF